jgi:lipopolysaccharide cholinephosphotransferase
MASKKCLLIFLIVTTVLLAITVLVVSLGFRFFYCEHYGPAAPLKKPIRLYMHSAEVHNKSEEALRRITTVLKENNLQHWPIGGTLIGCLRHQGPIPWDDDVDLGILEDEFEAVGRALREAYGKNIKFFKELTTPMFRMWKVKFKDLPGLYIDLFSFKRKSGRVKMAGHFHSFIYGGEVTPEQWLFPLKRDSLKFGRLHLDGPAEAEKMCEFFAPGYMNMYIIHTRHSAYKKPWNMFMRKRYIEAEASGLLEDTL